MKRKQIVGLPGTMCTAAAATTITATVIFASKNHAYENVEAQICLKFKNIVVIILVAISISFPASDEI